MLSLELRNADIKKDLTGKHFGRLFVISYAHKEKYQGSSHWVCACSCGNIAVVCAKSLKTATKSCGCIARERMVELGRSKRTHGLSGAGLGHIYQSMVSRCKNETNRAYHRYGGRGIRVCEEWQDSPSAFYDWAFANGYRDDLEIDRINNDMGYKPGNCRWVTSTTNQNNRGNNRRITVGGVTKTLAEWAKEIQVDRMTIDRRISLLGWSELDAVTTPALKTWCRKKGSRSH